VEEEQMARIQDLICEALNLLPEKPADTATQSDKKRYSEQVSQKLAVAIAQELRERGLEEARPAGEGDFGDSGAERRMAGGLGAKKVDVTWATEESGLLFAISIKTINFRDSKTKNFQKNLTNRRGDMLMEAVTLHRRFPYAVLAGFFFLDKGAETDGTKKPDGSQKRRSTLENAHMRLKLFTGRDDPSGREEQFERFYLLLLDASPKVATVRAFQVGHPGKEVPLQDVFDDLLKLVAERNPDFYEFFEGSLRRAT
jgi:hypothetical protein